MDDILQFLLIAGIIVIGIVKQFKKEAKRTLTTAPLCPCRTLTLTMTHCPFPKAGERLMADISPKVPNRNRNPFPQLKKNTNSLLQNIFLEEILQIHPPNLLRLRRNRRFLLLHPYSKSPKLIPNMRSIRQKKHEKLLSGRKYCNESINKRKVES